MPRHDEEWRPSPSFPDYEVSDRGRVRRGRRHLTPFVYRKRWCVCLRSHRHIPIASLVAETFLGIDRADLKTKLKIVHRNGDPGGNRPRNLLIVPRRNTPMIDLQRASDLMDDGVASPLVTKLTGVKLTRLRKHRRTKKRDPA